MRTLIILLVGTALAGVCLFISRQLLGSTAVGLRVFLALWFIAAAVNLWIGVRHAGYSVAEELPIFGLIFGLPAILAFLATLRFK
jgi:hypothetical protein